MKGVSPIVSTILMVAIAIAAAVVVYYITMDVITKQGAQLQKQVGTGQDQIVIDAIQDINNSGTHTITAYMRNVGDHTVKVTNAYVLDQDGTVKCAPDTPPNTEIQAGESGTVTISNCSGLNQGSTYTVKVTTSGGGVATKIFTAQ